jgi:hypothetical protein
MNAKKCDTMSCKATATHRLSWVDEFEETVIESVCEPCGQGYVTRPRLKATLEPLNTEAPQSGYTPCAGDRVRITRYRPDGKTHFIKVGEILEWWGHGGVFSEDVRPGRRVVTSSATLAEGMPGWTQTIERDDAYGEA